MEPPARPDPDFDPASARPIRLVDPEFASYRRVAVNPFLAVLALVGWLYLARWLFLGTLQAWGVASAFGLVGLPWLVHYHCLDCGRTGVYPRLGRHACPGILARERERRPSRTILPGPRAQLVVWAYLIVSGSIILAVSHLPGR